MEPVNEHDPTMDAHIVHAVNVNNKKEVAEMKFLTKSLANARHVQESIYRQEEKDLLRQLWKLHLEKERRHPELGYPGRSEHGLKRLSSDRSGSFHSSRQGSHNVLHHPKERHHQPYHPPAFSQQRTHEDRLSFTRHAGEHHHPSTSHQYHAVATRDASSHHIPFSETSSHHFIPEFVHHRHPEYYPPQPAHRRHVGGGYQPPAEIPGLVLQSSRLNAIVQPAGYGHSVAEHAAHLGMHRHYHRGVPYHPTHRPPQMHSSQPTDSVRDFGSYESLTKYITLLDYQASEEAKAGKHPKGAPNHHPLHQHRQQAQPRVGSGRRHPPRPEEVEDEEPPVLERKSGEDATEAADKEQGKMERPKSGAQMADPVILQDDQESKAHAAKPKSLGFTGVPSATPSPTVPAASGSHTDRDRQPPIGDLGKVRRHSYPRLKGTEGHPQGQPAEKTDLVKRPGAKHPGKEKETARVGATATEKSGRRDRRKSRDRIDNQASQGELLPHRSSHHQYISRYPSSYASLHPPHHLTKQILEDLQAIATRPSHHSHHPRQVHHHLQDHPGAVHAHHQPTRQQAPVTAAERKRLAVELLAREYPVLLRHAPTKFDPLEALMCRYLRLSSTNVETLEEMCKEAGIQVGAHAHHQVDNVNEYVFGHEK